MPLPTSLPPDRHSAERFAMAPAAPPARAALPLQGLTILAVEDSRFASEALRLMCHRSGARLRRADSLQAARQHLRVYRPDVVIVDLGLPDGRGEGLIRDLAMTTPRLAVLLGTSGDPDGRAAALAAGACGYIEKPLDSLVAFQQAVLRHLPDRMSGLLADTDALHPDPLALHDDMALAATLIAAGPTPQQRRYLAGFVGGFARHAHDAALEKAAGAVLDATAPLDPLARLLQHRLTQGPAPFAGTNA